MCIYIFCYCLMYKAAIILDKVIVYINLVSFTLERKMFKVLIFSILIYELVLSIFVCILKVFNYNKLCSLYFESYFLYRKYNYYREILLFFSILSFKELIR